MPRVLLTQMWTMFRKDVRLVYRNPMAFGLLVVMPFLLISVISGALTPLFEGASSFVVPVVDLDRSPESEQLLASIDEAEVIELKHEDWAGAEFSQEDADAIFDDSRENFVVLVVPEGFGDSLAAGDPIGITMYADPVQEGFAGVIMNEVRGRLLTGALLTGFTRVLIEEGQLTPEQAEAIVAAELRPLTGDDGLTVNEVVVSETRALPSNFEQTVPGFAVMFTFWLAAILAGSIFVERRLYRTWQRTLMAPVPRWAIVLSRICAYVALGVLQMTVLFVLGWLVYGMSLGSDLFALLLIMTAMALVTTTFGFLMSGLIRDVTLMNMTTNLLVLVLAGIGGAIVPVFFLPGWAQTLSMFTPHYWAIDGIQQVIILDSGVVDVLPQIMALLAFAIVFFTIGLFRFRFSD